MKDNKNKTVEELMEFLSNGIKNMRYLSKERQNENQQYDTKIINLAEYRNERKL